MDEICPAEDIGLCRCKQGLEMLHHEDASYYPKAGCFRIGRKLYNARWIGAGRHYWKQFILTPNWVVKSSFKVGVQHQFRFHGIIVSGAKTLNVIMPVKAMLYNLPPVMHIWRIQRQIRRFLAHKLNLNNRLVAVMMALHPLLGCQSPLCLPEDVLRLTLGYY